MGARYWIPRRLWGNETSETSRKQITTSFLGLSGGVGLNHSAALDRCIGEIGRLKDIW